MNLGFGCIQAAAESWRKRLDGVTHLWLCWNVDSDWCLVQQKLVTEVGWTPVVGYDPRVGPPQLLRNAVCIDFNEAFGLPTMWLHFPVEFIFLFCERMAFWHADLILRRDKMRMIAETFAALPDGAAAAVIPDEGRIAAFGSKKRRYWEVIGCNTRGASKSQFDNGCGWWMNFWMHPSNSPKQRAERSAYYYDSGAGFRFWHKKCSGKMHLIPNNYIAEDTARGSAVKTTYTRRPTTFIAIFPKNCR